MNYRKHIGETLLLSAPLIVAQIGHIITGMTDNIFLGKFFGETEQAAGILANQLFVVLLVFNIGLSFGITPLVSAASVNGNEEDKAAVLKNALFLIPLISVFLAVILFFSSPVLGYMRQPEEVVKLAKPFFNVLAFSIIPVSIFFVCKQYCEGLSSTIPSMLISIGGNLLNIVLNYFLITGKSIFPSMGYMGSAWATFYARCLMAVGFLLLVFLHKKTRPDQDVYRRVKINWGQLKKLAFIGLGSAFQLTFEVAAFIIAAFMSGTFGKESIDAHGIAISIAAFTYMFASGISGAATIRVGNFFAAKDRLNTRRAGLSAFLIVIITMGFFGLVFLALHKILPWGFTDSARIAEMSSGLLFIAAFFQLGDGIQVTGLGILRGMEDVKFPTIITLIGYWAIALPLCYVLAFVAGWKVYGIWISLSISLTLVAIALYWRFRKIAA